MADDIVKHLRAEASAYADGDWSDQVLCRRFTEAADEIERLRAEHSFVERLAAGQLSARLTEVEAERDAERAEVERLHRDLKHARAEIDHHVSGIIAERALADQLFEAMGAVQWAIPSFDPSLTTWNAAVTAYREARRG